jgi:hypothetical protein
MTAEDIVIGKEYEYLDDWVKAIRVDGKSDWAEVVIETRFGSRTTVPVTELRPKHARN